MSPAKSPTKSPKTGVVVWLTGLSGAGKSTVAHAVGAELERRGISHERLDGDVVRARIGRGLGFSRADREESLMRISYVCELLIRHGVVVVVSAIAPYRDVRQKIREQLGSFIEVFVDCPLEVCAQRDVKGLYKKAQEGKVQKMTGVDDPYEPPTHPEVVLHTDREDVATSAARVVRALEERGWI